MKHHIDTLEIVRDYIQHDKGYVQTTVGELADGRMVCDPCYILGKEDYSQLCKEVGSAPAPDTITINGITLEFVDGIDGDGCYQGLGVDAGWMAVFDKASSARYLKALRLIQG